MFIPLFPLGSVFVTGSQFRKRNGFQMSVNRQSVIAVYGRVLSLILGAVFLVFAYDDFTSYGGSLTTSALAYLILGIVCGAICIYFYLYYGKPTPEDTALRNKIGQLTGYYALPHWFDYGDLRNSLRELKLKYQEKYPDDDWKADLQNTEIEPEKRLLIFGLALFNCMVNDLPENDELYEKATQLEIAN